MCFHVQLYLHKWHFEGDVTDGSTAGGSRPPSMSTTGTEMGISTRERVPEKGRGNQTGWEGGMKSTPEQSEKGASDWKRLQRASLQTATLDSVSSLKSLRWRGSIKRWKSSTCTPPPLPLCLPAVQWALLPWDQATQGPLDLHAWCRRALLCPWTLSGLITCPCVYWQMNPTRSWLWRPWRSWTGVWISWRRYRPTAQSATWPLTR